MPGYLLDVNHVHGIFHNQKSVVKRFNALPADTQIRVCTTTLGEIEAGLKMTRAGNPERRREYQKHVVETYHPFALRVTTATGRYYAEIMGRIWQLHPPASSDIDTDAHLVSLGVDINDVWLVAVAWEHGLTVVTTDRMRVIKEAVGKDVAFDNWHG